MDNDLYTINPDTGQFELKKRIPELQYISRYLPRIDPNDKEERPRTIDITFPVFLCERCNQQHSFIIVSEIKRKSKNIDQETGEPRVYVKGYMGYCMGCYDRMHGITPSGIV